MEYPPIPAPRRSLRIKRDPEWKRSGDYVYSQQQPEWLNRVNMLKSLASDDLFLPIQSDVCKAIVRIVAPE